MFTYTSLYTRIFNFSHFHDFHIPSVYQNSHISTTFQKFCYVPVLYQAFSATFLFFDMVRHFLVDTSEDMVIYI